MYVYTCTRFEAHVITSCVECRDSLIATRNLPSINFIIIANSLFMPSDMNSLYAERAMK